jgi:protein SCO1
LNLQYRQLPDGSFNHASVITLLSPTGEILAQSAMLAKVDNTLLEAGSKSHQLSDR